MEGYDEKWVDNIDKFECAICALVYKDCVQDQKGHRFCDGCVKNQPNCPLCRQKATYVPDYATREAILNLQVICPRCEKTVDLRHVDKHGSCLALVPLAPDQAPVGPRVIPPVPLAPRVIPPRQTIPFATPLPYGYGTAPLYGGRMDENKASFYGPSGIRGTRTRQDVEQPSFYGPSGIRGTRTRQDVEQPVGEEKQVRFYTKLLPKCECDCDEKKPLSSGFGWAYLSLSFHKYTKSATLRWKIELRETCTLTHIDFHGPARYYGCEAPIVFRANQQNLSRPSQVLGEQTLSSSQANQIVAGKWYMQLCTTRYPCGELRGYIY